MSKPNAICAALSLLFLAAAAPAETIDNPRYLAWCKFGAGSSATLKGEVTSAAGKIEMEATHKLLEISADEVDIEITTNATVLGQARPAQVKTEKIPAKIDPKEGSFSEASSDVEAMGKKYKCRLLEVVKKDPRTSTDYKAKMWFSPDIPGGCVKIDTMVVSPNGKGMDISMLLSAFDAR